MTVNGAKELCRYDCGETHFSWGDCQPKDVAFVEQPTQDWGVPFALQSMHPGQPAGMIANLEIQSRWRHPGRDAWLA